MAVGSALLIIDMQRDFCDPSGYAAQTGIDIGRLRAPIPNIRALIAAARQLGIAVIHTREGHRPDLSDLHPAKLRRSRRARAEIGSAGPLGRLLVRGEAGHAIIAELEPLPGETIVDKPGYGAFHATDLELLLRNAAVAQLYLTGVTTDICVHSTLREAVDRGFECVTIGDACAAADAGVHEAMLACIAGEGGILGEVQTTEAVLGAWRAAA